MISYEEAKTFSVGDVIWIEIEVYPPGYIGQPVYDAFRITSRSLKAEGCDGMRVKLYLHDGLQRRDPIFVGHPDEAITHRCYRDNPRYMHNRRNLIALKEAAHANS